MRRDVFQAIADPTRRAIIQLLSKKSLNLNAVAENFKISRPAVSQHLKALLDCNLVTVSASGTHRIYSVNTKGFNKLNLWLDQFWS